ncbi:sulfatase-like hydrolase/transferase [Chloroflexi bacterium TSY]|nr:sulfatase-like hydrolase/transferase [Chloroflexi bacterium TSY]
MDRGILDGTAGPDRMSLIKSGAGQSSYQVHDEYVTAATVDLLNQLGVQKRTYGEIDPFSITVGFMLPHAPFVARKAEYDYYRERIGMPKKQTPFAETTHPYMRAWRTFTGLEEATPDEMVLRARAAYWGLVHAVDMMVGQILEALEANGLADNTMIVYTSDHGDMVGEHGLWWKHVFYEESVRVPLIVSWPGVVRSGQRISNVVSALDVAATMVDALDAPPLTNAAGRSFLGLISDERPTPDWVDIAFSEYCADQYTPGSPTPTESRQLATCYQRMVRYNEWKLIYDHGAPPQLFNLAEDPGELTNRAGGSDCQELLETLRKRILADWDPEAIAEILTAKRTDNAILSAWAKNTEPGEQYRWDLKPEMNSLL